MTEDKFWIKYFEVYDTLNYLIPYQETLDAIVMSSEVHEGSRVLDLGSGTGNLSVKMAAKGAHVTGVDNSLAGISIHKRKQPDCHIIYRDITLRLPFEDEYFDLVCSNNVFYTLMIQDRQNLYNEVFRVLKTGGCIVVSNIAVGFSPKKIYFTHISQSIRNKGVFNTFVDVIKLVIPTVRIFYYNYLIKRKDTQSRYSFVEQGEQERMMKTAGFRVIGESMKSYGNQAILTKGVKI